MALAPVPLLQRQLDTTLQLVILLSSNMAADQIHLVRVHLTEASVVLGQILADRERNGVIVNGKLKFLPLSPFPHLSRSDSHLNHPLATHAEHAATVSNLDANNSGSGSRRAVTRPTPTHRSAQRPVTRSSIRRNSSGSRRPIIVIGTDSEED